MRELNFTDLSTNVIQDILTRCDYDGDCCGGCGCYGLDCGDGCDDQCERA